MQTNELKRYRITLDDSKIRREKFSERPRILVIVEPWDSKSCPNQEIIGP
jgi:hypothetical protein